MTPEDEVDEDPFGDASSSSSELTSNPSSESFPFSSSSGWRTNPRAGGAGVNAGGAGVTAAAGTVSGSGPDPENLRDASNVNPAEPPDPAGEPGIPPGDPTLGDPTLGDPTLPPENPRDASLPVLRASSVVSPSSSAHPAPLPSTRRPNQSARVSVAARANSRGGTPTTPTTPAGPDSNRSAAIAAVAIHPSARPRPPARNRANRRGRASPLRRVEARAFDRAGARRADASRSIDANPPSGCAFDAATPRSNRRVNGVRSRPAVAATASAAASNAARASPTTAAARAASPRRRRDVPRLPAPRADASRVDEIGPAGAFHAARVVSTATPARCALADARARSAGVHASREPRRSPRGPGGANRRTDDATRPSIPATRRGVPPREAPRLARRGAARDRVGGATRTTNPNRS